MSEAKVEFRVRRQVTWNIGKHVTSDKSVGGSIVCQVPAGLEAANALCLQIAEAHRQSNPSHYVSAFPYQSDLPSGGQIDRPVNSVGLGVRSAVRLTNGVCGIVTGISESGQYSILTIGSNNEAASQCMAERDDIELVFSDDIFGSVYQRGAFEVLPLKRLMVVSGAAGTGKTAAILGHAIVAATREKLMGNQTERSLHVILDPESSGKETAQLLRSLGYHANDLLAIYRSADKVPKKALMGRPYRLYIDSAEEYGLLSSPDGIRFCDEALNKLALGAESVTITQHTCKKTSMQLTGVTYGPRMSMGRPSLSQIPRGKK